MKSYGRMLRVGLFLMTLSLIAALALAVTHQLTEPVIGMQQERRLMENLRQVLPEADEFVVEDETEDRIIYAGYRGDELLGYAVIIETGGYADKIRVVVGLDLDLRVMTPVRILRHLETPGLGSRVQEEKWFREQFVGKGLQDPLELGEDFDGIAGATISSRAVGSAVSAGVGELGEYLGETVTTEVDLSHVPDGVYRGAGRGFRDDIRVEVEVIDGRIVRVEVVEHSETPDVAEPAIEVVPSEMKDRQEVYVDAVAGATATTEGIIGAVEDALLALGADEPGFDLADVPDGVYRGEGTGYAGSLTVEVEVRDGRLVHIEIVDHYEIPSYVQDVLEAIPSTMLQEQQVVVDAYSGATETTEGIIGAVKDALVAEGPEFDLADVPDGVYRGEGTGYAGSLTVEVEVRDGRLVHIEVVDHYEIPSYVQDVLDVIPSTMLQEQQVVVDAYSGATETTFGIIEAVKNTLRETLDDEDITDIGAIDVPDGVYTGLSEGFGGDLEIEVEFRDGQLHSVEVIDHEETPDIGEPAIDSIIRIMVEEQRLDVDAYGGATVTSEALIRAVRSIIEREGELDME